MKSPRLVGPVLRATVALGGTPPGQRLLYRQAGQDYHIEVLRNLPAHLLGTTPDTGVPLAGASPRQWGDGKNLEAPTPSTRRAASQLREAYAAGRIRPSEVLDATLARIDRGAFGSVTYSPFVTLLEETARDAAAASDARWAAGEELGPLDGVVVPVKDEFDAAGAVTRGGTAYRNTPATADSHVVVQLRAAGAIVVGKTHSTEWGMNPIGLNPHFDMPRNPYDPQRAAGGSSTGAGAAVALGLAPVAVGSDGGGSIRIPAALTGVFGIKPTFVRLGRSGNIFGAGSVAAAGPLGASTQDLVDLLACTSAPDPLDPASQRGSADDISNWRAALGRGVRGARIGVLRAWFATADARIASVCLQALDQLAAEGAVLVDVDIAGLELSQSAGVLAIGPETWANLQEDQRAHGGQFSLELQLLMHVLGSLRAPEVLMAQRLRAGLRRETARALANVDVLVAPTTPIVAPAYPLSETRVDISDSEATRALCRYAFLANLTGLPAGTAPVGRVDGLPVGLQVIGDAWDEASVLAILAHLERMGVSSLPRPAGCFDPLG